MNKRNKIIASVFFVLALIVVTHTSAYFYIESQYPTSENILRNKKSDGKFNSKFEEAKEANYSEKEIYEYLSTRNEKISARYYKNIIIAETALFLCYFFASIGFIIMTKEKMPNKTNSADAKNRAAD